jgi:hypothetical protein
MFCPLDEEDGQMMSHGLKWNRSLLQTSEWKLSAQNTDQPKTHIRLSEWWTNWLWICSSSGGLQDLWACMMFWRAVTSCIAVRLWRLQQNCVQRLLVYFERRSKSIGKQQQQTKQPKQANNPWKQGCKRKNNYHWSFQTQFVVQE